MSRLNILWICTDSQRFDTLGCYGNQFVHSPNIDRLASEGVLFERAYCQNPLCQPSRACFLTGRYPVTTRVRQNGQDIPASEVLVTKLLAAIPRGSNANSRAATSSDCPVTCSTAA